MDITSVGQFEDMIMKRCKVAVARARDEIYNIIDEFLARYYIEFEPELYLRTRQLLNSLVKTEVKLVGDTIEASVYFDLDSLDYSVKTLKGVGKWRNTFHREGWTHENDIAVFEMAAHGSHGGYKKGTAVWDDPIKVIDKKAIKILKDMLIAQGIPIGKQ